MQVGAEESKMKKEQNHWLSERSKLFAKYAEGLPMNSSYVQLSFDKPEYGWIDMHVSVNYNEKDCIELSNAIYEPFGDLKEWLEHIVTKCGSFPEAGSIVQLDCEHYKVVLYYEPILYTEPGYRGHIFKNNKYGCGLFYIYNEALESITANTIVGTKDLVKSFYLSIINYAKEMQQNENFVENWVWDAYNSEMHDYDEDSPELKDFFLKKVRSKIIEEYLGIKE